MYDTAYPDAKDYSEVIITVIRDESGPIFRPSATYQITIPDTTPIGSSIIAVDAIDPDNVSASSTNLHTVLTSFNFNQSCVQLMVFIKHNCYYIQ